MPLTLESTHSELYSFREIMLSGDFIVLYRVENTNLSDDIKKTQFTGKWFSPNLDYVLERYLSKYIQSSGGKIILLAIPNSTVGDYHASKYSFGLKSEQNYIIDRDELPVLSQVIEVSLDGGQNSVNILQEEISSLITQITS